MLKYFTRILIFTLILTAPLSFTGDKCPDFKPASEIRQCRQLSAAAIIIKKQCDRSFTGRTDPSSSK